MAVSAHAPRPLCRSGWSGKSWRNRHAEPDRWCLPKGPPHALHWRSAALESPPPVPAWGGFLCIVAFVRSGAATDDPMMVAMWWLSYIPPSAKRDVSTNTCVAALSTASNKSVKDLGVLAGSAIHPLKSLRIWRAVGGSPSVGGGSNG